MILPAPLNLSSALLERHGLYLIEDGQSIFLWVGREAIPQLVIDVFNIGSYNELRPGKVSFVNVLFWSGCRADAAIHETANSTRVGKLFLAENQCYHWQGSRSSSRSLLCEFFLVVLYLFRA